MVKIVKNSMPIYLMFFIYNSGGYMPHSSLVPVKGSGMYYLRCLAILLITTAAGFLTAFLLLSMGAGPSISAEDITVPNLSKIKPFSSEANMMSLEGYVISYCKIHHGKKISKSEARRIIKRSLKMPPCQSNKDKIKFLSECLLNKPAYFDSKKILLLPFINNNGSETESIDLVNYFTKKLFTGRGYNVIIPAGTDKKYISCSTAEIEAAAKRYGAEYVIFGNIDHCQKYKRFRLAGFLFDYAFTSVHSYADIIITAEAYSVSKKTIVFHGSSYGHKKHQWFALFHGTGAVLSYAVNDAVCGLFENFLNKCNGHEKSGRLK